jgi:hypothetical protein
MEDSKTGKKVIYHGKNMHDVFLIANFSLR